MQKWLVIIHLYMFDGAAKVASFQSRPPTLQTMQWMGDLDGVLSTGRTSGWSPPILSNTLLTSVSSRVLILNTPLALFYIMLKTSIIPNSRYFVH